ncbi:M48 family metallopeptidase [Noviluteimonas dokdonensis]|nr:SprT family zinc-dependent metalloprotease [Lysobacter dokdonensis]
MPHLRRLLAPRLPVIERDVTSVELDDGRSIEIQRVRNPRARRLRLSVDERGARLTLPQRASLVSGERFLVEHRAWLAEQLDRYTLQGLPELQRRVTAALPLRGADIPLRWEDGRFTSLEFDAQAGHAVFRTTQRASDAALRRAVRDFYEGQARTDIGRWLPKYLPTLPRPPRRVQFKVMSSQWGSLAPNGVVALDLALVLARPSAFEYVLVHELCHILRADHSRAFWLEVERRFPSWRAERDYFHADGRRLKATLRALLSG